MSTVHPIPSSVIIVNESTPLLSHEQQQASGIIPNVEPAKSKIGLIWVIFSSFMFTIVSVNVKLLSKEYTTAEIVLARGSIQALLGLIACLVWKIHPLGTEGVRLWILLRSFITSITLILVFYGLSHLPLLDTTVLFFMGPVFTLWIHAFDTNSFTIKEGVYSIGCLLGTIVLVKPHALFHDTTQQPSSYGPLSVLIAACLSAFAYRMAYRVGHGTHVLVHIVYTGITASVISILYLVLKSPPFPVLNGYYGFMLTSTGILAFGGQWLLNIGLQWSPAYPSILLRQSDIVFASLFGIFLFGETPATHTIIGTLMIGGLTTAIDVHCWQRKISEVLAIRKKKSKDRLIQKQQKQQQQQQHL